MPANPHRYYTLMFIPDDRSKPYTLRIRRNIVRTITSLVLLWAAALIFVLMVMGRISLRLHMVDSLETERSRLVEENRRLNAALAKSRNLQDMSDYFERIAQLTAPAAGRDSIRRIVAVAAQPADSLAQVTPAPEAVEAPAAMPAAADFVAATPSISPVDGWITRRFSEEPGAGQHPGIDFAVAQGTPIRAPAPGTVLRTGHDPFLGLVVTVEHRHGFTTRYAHCSQILAIPGQRVERGQTLALVGNTGRSTAPHLHYEVLRDGVAQDPAKYIWGAGVD